MMRTRNHGVPRPVWRYRWHGAGRSDDRLRVGPGARARTLVGVPRGTVIDSWVGSSS